MNDKAILKAKILRHKTMSDDSIQTTIEFDEFTAGKAMEYFRVKGTDVAIALLNVNQYGEIKNDLSPESNVTESSNIKPDYGQQAKILVQSSFFRSPEVWKAIGTDQELIEWTRTQPCCVCGKHEAVQTKNGGYYEASDAAHVRRIADGAGTGIKPPYSVIPLCRECHSKQHQSGEAAIGGKGLVDELRIENVQLWAKERLKRILAVESLKYLNPNDLVKWAEEKQISRFLPGEYK